MTGGGSESEAKSTTPDEVDPAVALLRERFGPAPLRQISHAPARPLANDRPLIRVTDSEFECAQRRRDLMEAMDDRRDRHADVA